MWTLRDGRTEQTEVVDVVVAHTRALVDVSTDHATFAVTPEQLLRTPGGWTHAGDAVGTVVAWAHARKLRRERLSIRPGYQLGYLIGATCSDGTVGKNYVSLVVNDEAFAAKYARSLTGATGLAARLEAVTRPSGYLGRDVPGFRVRVVSSYLADLMRQYVGGDAHHMRQSFPRVVLKDEETFGGFLDGYEDGDGYRITRWPARVFVSSNTPFLADIAEIIGARFTPRTDGLSSHLVVADSWPKRGTFRTEEHDVELDESAWVEVGKVTPRAPSTKPSTLYGFRLTPHPDFLVNGHLVRVPWAA
ncbi:hypothetical protein M8Z33_15105 [Streptomyces sp. ZAF1911]|uniref:hypothetical protein n=1 Tax=Streptomyces sp. ZAF1911 TaxID=2944129 RepID=UPI00237ADDC3|nr:hypothetical protein [Streptomyces sp. ZAF1911]MDD9377962.1 hypothetical protein [Streptomyces sp. ZAF1911]